MKRRDFLLSASLSALVGCQSTVRTAEDGGEQQQKGDVDAPAYEVLAYDPHLIEAMVERDDGRATFKKWDKDLPKKLITTAESFLGSSRDTTPETITELLELFKLPFKTEGGYVPFCAAGLSYCALAAFSDPSDPKKPAPEKPLRLHQFRQLMPDVDHYYFYPTVSCMDMYFIAQGRRRWKAAQEKKKNVVPRAGWIALFDWSGKGNAEHCGVVTSATDSVVSTIEFNTSGKAGDSERDGGTVSRKERDYKYIMGFVMTDTTPRA